MVRDRAARLRRRYLVGVHESPGMVRNDGTNLAGTIAILRYAAAAARILRIESAFSQRGGSAAEELAKSLQRLYNGRYLQASEDSDAINMSSIAPIYPMQLVDYHSLLLQPHRDEVRLFPAVPSAWAEAAFYDLLAAGLSVSAEFDGASGRVEGTVRNLSLQPPTRILSWGTAKVHRDAGAGRRAEVPVYAMSDR